MTECLYGMKTAALIKCGIEEIIISYLSSLKTKLMCVTEKKHNCSRNFFPEIYKELHHLYAEIGMKRTN